jgi:glycosyltransferase involved in cell wall biosynthesis
MSKLRLLLVTDAVGGVWTYSLELARALEPLGVETVLAVTGPSPSAEQRAATSRMKLIDTGLPLEWLDTGPAEIAAAGKALALIAACEGADVVQTSGAALLAGGAFEQPIVAVQHSCVATWWAAVKGTPLPDDFRWRSDLVAQGLSKADAVVAPTRAFAAATERAYDLDRRVLAVHNGRTAQKLRELPQGDFVFTAGRLWDEGKNVATLDRAAARIRAPFQAAGSTKGPNGASIALEHLIALGSLSEARVAGVMAARPVFASAALYEPFGLSVLEAARAGCALVLSDIASHRELWDGAALFIDPRDDAGFASTVNDLLEKRDERERLGKSARERALRYSPERMAREMTGLYARVLQPQPQLAGAA